MLTFPNLYHQCFTQGLKIVQFARPRANWTANRELLIIAIVRFSLPLFTKTDYCQSLEKQNL